MKFEVKLTFVIILLFSSSFFASAQKLNHVLGDVLVKIDENQKIETLVERFQHFQNTPTQLRVISLTSRPLNIWLLHFNQNTINEFHFLEFLRRQKSIDIAQFNHLVTMRQTTPNDNLFGSQWQYVNDGSNGGVEDADIDADLAWDITTGGVTAEGDTIVAAILDNGVELSHPDFEDNLWINYAEIPNDGIDNDNNGYVDDYRGWNIISDNDNIAGGSHGTPVTGIVGAKGNNSLGVTGVNWNVKLMIVKNDFNTNEAAVLEAYTYPLEMRRKYNETDGAEGAFVVSTNASWGVNFGQPEDAPLWCAFYDTLGVSGIISCGATINGNQNVDEVGDLPTACPSDFLISVTNMNRSDNKVFQAGYGAETIDLGAPGEDAFTTSNGNNYSGFGGTSGATPHVTGAIALLYAAPCPNLIALAKTNPEAAATQVRDYILNGVDPNASLDSITTTGGRLNIFNSLTLLMNNCGPCPPALALNATEITDTQAILDWIPGTNADSSTLRWRHIDSINWNVVLNASNPFPLSGLEACIEYEFQIDAVCPDENSGFTDSFVFETDGCCVPPSNILVDVTSDTTASLSWDTVLAADSYTIFLSGPGGTFEIEGITEIPYNITSLESCTSYSISILTNCDGMPSDQSDLIDFSTTGCGACTDLDYCGSEGEDTQFEWIETIELNAFINNSGDDGGYGDYTGTPIELMTFNTYEIILTPGFGGISYGEYFKVWIDFNQNGTFEEPEELVFDPGTGSDQEISGNILIENGTPLGITRMRIGMRWEGTGGTSTPAPCSNNPNGEVEDYCVNILPGEPTGCDLPINLDTMDLTSFATNIIWEDPTDDHTDHNLKYKKTIEPEWTVIENVTSPYALTSLEKCVEYEVQIEANCTDGNTSGYTESIDFLTNCEASVNDLFDLQEINIYPIPFVDQIILEFQLRKSSDLRIDLLSTNGQKLATGFFNNLGQGDNRISFKNLEKIPAGVYFLKMLTSDNVIKIKKIIKY
jgi:Subtilase family/GEVED domain/Secretion system C-terminal sorting domain